MAEKIMIKEEIIKHYKTIFDCEQFVVTGSYALQRYGLLDKSDDLDIIVVNPKKETIECIQRLVKENPAETSGSGSIFIFKHKDTKIDVFVLNQKIDSIKLEEGFELSTIKRIVDEKKKMNRSKDWIQLVSVARKIVTTSEIENYLKDYKL
jgi:hypothetical protein